MASANVPTILWAVDAESRAQALEVLKRLVPLEGWEIALATGDGLWPVAALGEPPVPVVPFDSAFADGGRRLLVSWCHPAEAPAVPAAGPTPWIAVAGATGALSEGDLEALTRADLVLASAAAAALQLEGRLPAAQLETIGCGVDVDAFRPLAGRKTLRRQHGLGRGLCVGLWVAGGGLAAVRAGLVAFAALKRAHPDAEMVLLADPTQVDWHLDDWKTRLNLTPVVCNASTALAQAPDWRNRLWNLMDVILMQSGGDERLQLEMMAAGRPVVAPSAPGGPNRADDPGAALTGLVQSSRGSRAAARAARQHAEAHSWETVADGLRRHLARLAGRRGRPRPQLSLPPLEPTTAANRPPSRSGGARSPALRRVRILTHPGLGDTLLAATIAYAFAEAGHVPTIGLHDQSRYPYRMTGPCIHDLPVLPLLGHGATDEDLDITTLAAFDWLAETDMAEAICRELGVSITSTPRTGMLAAEAGYTATARDLVGAAGFVLVAPRGHCHADAKAMSPGQIATIARVARDQGLATAVVHSGPLAGLGADVVSLCGGLAIADLCALTASAKAVVSTDTGVLHLAGAFGVPVLGLIPAPTNPRGVLPQYSPCLALEAARTADIGLPAVATGLAQILTVADAPWFVIGPDRQACGIAQHAHRIAAATGAPWRSQPPSDGYCVAAYHPHLPRETEKLDPLRTVIDAHHINDLDPGRWGGIIVHNATFYRTLRGQCRRCWYIPLPCDETRREVLLPARPRTILWHGLVTKDKGLDPLIEGFRPVRQKLADAQLRIVGSTGSEIVDQAVAGRLAALDEPGVQVRLRDYWPAADLNAELQQADVFCYMDTNDAEQSACSPMGLGYGRPVVVSRSSKHNDVRGWAVTAADDLADVLLRLLTDARAYADAAVRAWQGASYRSPELVARQYRGAMQQVMLDGHCAGLTSQDD